MSKCNDDSAGEPECLQKDDDEQYDEPVVQLIVLEILVEIWVVVMMHGDWEFSNVIVDADGEHNNDKAASDVNVIDVESEADGFL